MSLENWKIGHKGIVHVMLFEKAKISNYDFIVKLYNELMMFAKLEYTKEEKINSLYDDLAYFNNKMLVGLAVPKSYLNPKEYYKNRAPMVYGNSRLVADEDYGTIYEKNKIRTQELYAFNSTNEYTIKLLKELLVLIKLFDSEVPMVDIKSKTYKQYELLRDSVIIYGIGRL